MKTCDICNKQYVDRRSLKNHKRNIHNVQIEKPTAVTYSCYDCEHQETSLSRVQDHFSSIHRSKLKHLCNNCFTTFDNDSSYADHMFLTHGLPIFINNAATHAIEQSAFSGNLKTYKIEGDENSDYDLLAFLVKNKERLQQIVAENVRDGSKKIQFCVETTMQRTDEDGELSFTTMYALTDMVLVWFGGLSDDDYQGMIDQLLLTLYNFTYHGSGWVLQHVKQLIVKVAMYNPVQGSSFIDLPTNLKGHKNVFVNIRNRDNKCFELCYTAAYHIKYGPPLLPADCNYKNLKTSPDTYSKPGAKKPSGNFTMPMSINEISRFERINDAQINVFCYQKGQLLPLRVSKSKGRLVMDLLLLTDNSTHHYVLITDITKLICLLRGLKHRTRNCVCRNCLHVCSDELFLRKHRRTCFTNAPAVIKTPALNKSELKFSKYEARHFAPWCIYFDLESILEPVSTCSNDPSTSSTNIIEIHRPCGFALTVVEHGNPRAIKFKAERSPDCMSAFLKELEKLAHESYQAKRKFRMYNGPQPTEEKEKCWICYETFTEANGPVLDHCHYTGKFFGWAHQYCNFNRKTINFTPVIAHNLSNYDVHHLCQALSELDPKHKISIIPQNSERFISLSIGFHIKSYKNQAGKKCNIYEHMRFIDSLKFMMAPLSNLADNLPDDKFQLLDNEFSDYTIQQCQLLHRKGYYPYSHAKSFDIFEETELPPLNMWKSSLRDGEIEITETELKKANEVFSVFNCQNFGEYHDIYLKTDTLVLACVFEAFRDICYGTYGLDPAQYYTASNLAGDAFLKVCKAPIQLLPDRSMIEMTESLIRGGVTSVFEKRLFTANNKYVRPYNKNEPSTYGFMIDANNLYGGVMMKSHLPLKDFCFKEDISIAQILATPGNSEKGYILEVDLSYPDALHDFHKDFPLAPLKESIKASELSDYQRDLLDIGNSKIKKLVQTLKDKHNYTVHYLTLQFYTSMGLQVSKVHRVLEF